MYMVDGSTVETDPVNLVRYGANILLSKECKILEIEIFSESGGGCSIPPSSGGHNSLPACIKEDFEGKLVKLLKE